MHAAGKCLVGGHVVRLLLLYEFLPRRRNILDQTSSNVWVNCSATSCTDTAMHGPMFTQPRFGFTIVAMMLASF